MKVYRMINGKLVERVIRDKDYDVCRARGWTSDKPVEDNQSKKDDSFKRKKKHLRGN